MAPRIDSELVRARCPSRSEIPRQVALVLHLVQQSLGAQRRGGEHDLVGGEHPGGRLASQLGLGVPHLDGVPASQVVGARGDAGDRGQRQHPGAVLLGEVEVVLDQRVLGVVAAAGHALPAVAAGVAVGALAAEERVGDDVVGRLPRPAEEDAHGRGVVGLAHAHLFGHLLHHVVAGRADRVVDDAEHPLGLVVVRRQLGAPVGDVAPRRVVVEGRQRLVQRVGVDQRPAADSGAGQDQAVLERVDALDAVEADLGPEQPALQVEGGRGELVVGEPGARLEHADAVALLGQPQRGHRTTEARADDQDVEVGHGRPSFLISRRLAVITLAYVGSDMPSIGAKRISRWVATDCDSV